MAVTADGPVALSAAGHFRTASSGLAVKNWRVVKLRYGELMGKKLNYAKFQQRVGNKNVRPHVCMSLTTNIVGEAKLRDLEMENGDPKTVVAITLGGSAGTRLFPLTKRRVKPTRFGTTKEDAYQRDLTINRYWLCAATEASIMIWDLERKSIVVDLRVDLKAESDMAAEGTATHTNVGKNKIAEYVFGTLVMVAWRVDNSKSSISCWHNHGLSLLHTLFPDVYWRLGYCLP